MKIYLEERCIPVWLRGEDNDVNLECDCKDGKKAKMWEDWLQRDQKCKSAIAKSKLEYVKDKASAKNMWDTLCSCS